MDEVSDETGACRDDHVICHNNGTCHHDQETNAVECLCDVEYTGFFCESGDQNMFFKPSRK